MEALFSLGQLQASRLSPIIRPAIPLYARLLHSKGESIECRRVRDFRKVSA